MEGSTLAGLRTAPVTTTNVAATHVSTHVTTTRMAARVLSAGGRRT